MSQKDAEINSLLRNIASQTQNMTQITYECGKSSAAVELNSKLKYEVNFCCEVRIITCVLARNGKHFNKDNAKRDEDYKV